MLYINIISFPLYQDFSECSHGMQLSTVCFECGKHTTIKGLCFMCGMWRKTELYILPCITNNIWLVVYCAHLAKGGVNTGTQCTEENAPSATPQRDQWFTQPILCTFLGPCMVEVLGIKNNRRWNNLTSRICTPHNNYCNLSLPP